MSRIIIVTGTDTSVGKTIATAAIALRAAEHGSVVVIKPAQTGIDGDEPTDGEIIAHLTCLPTETWASLPEPLAPATAARRAGVVLPTMKATADRIRTLEADTVVVEGAGGLLVHLDSECGTIADLTADLQRTHEVELVLVTRLGLGTLNHTSLALEALLSRRISRVSLVVGSVPSLPDLAESCNEEDLLLFGVPIIAEIPEGVAKLSPEEFQARCPGWFAHAATMAPEEIP